LKDFIEAKWEKNIDNDVNINHDIVEINESSQENDNIILLQKGLIEQITSPCVTKVRGAPSKKKLRSAMEVSRKRVPMQEIADKSNVQPIKQQRKCLLCGNLVIIRKNAQKIVDIRYVFFINSFNYFN
jgi:hypothetical protein